jgi:hypothetical protein
MGDVAEQVVEEAVHTDLECTPVEAAYWHSGTHRDSMVVVAGTVVVVVVDIEVAVVDTAVVVVNIEGTRD